MTRAGVLAITVLGAAPVLAGCAVGKLFGGMMQNYEYSKLVEVHPVYEGLENKSLAVVVDVDMATAWEHPEVSLNVSTNVAHQIQTNVEGARVLAPQIVADWQYRTPQWAALTYSEIAADLDVDRIVYIDVYEYRLNPPGNRWIWEGLCAANIGIVEREGFDPNSFVETFKVSSEYPKIKAVSRESAEAGAIQTGLIALFIQKTSWLFYTHLEPKYPDKYDGPSPESVWRDEQAKEQAKQAKQQKP